MLTSEEIKPAVLAIFKLCLFEGINKQIPYSGKFWREKTLANSRLNFIW